MQNSIDRTHQRPTTKTTWSGVNWPMEEQKIKSESEDSQDSQDENEDETQRRQHGPPNKRGTVLINHMMSAFTIRILKEIFLPF